LATSPIAGTADRTKVLEVWRRGVTNAADWCCSVLPDVDIAWRRHRAAAWRNMSNLAHEQQIVREDREAPKKDRKDPCTHTIDSRTKSPSVM
jgi:hypothetical protein